MVAHLVKRLGNIASRNIWSTDLLSRSMLANVEWISIKLGLSVC
jgi:hypothetical protein